MIQSDKNTIRSKIKYARQQLTEEFIRKNSDKIADKLFGSGAISKAEVIMSYFSFNNEVNTHGIIEKLMIMNKKVALPICRPDKPDLDISFISSISELKPGGFGIMEPDPNKLCIVKPEQIDIVIVPGIAFDRLGNRIGHGKGYYDRLLSKLSHSQVKIGLCFDFQLFDELAYDSFDVPVDCVITESSVTQRGK